MTKAANRATDLVRQILAFSRQQPQTRRILRLQDTLPDIFRFLRATLPSSLEISTHLDTPGAVLADATQIHQILVNLATNASQAIGSQPRQLELRLDAINVDAEQAAGTADLRPGPYARITVRDNGPGMDAATQTRIFDPFFTTKLDTLHFDYVAALAREHAAIVLERGKEYLVETRLTPLAHTLGHASLGDFIEHLRGRPPERAHRQVVHALTTNETSFFRDGFPFDALCKDLLPSLLARTATTRQLRIWSAACSTGQEPYSLAMLLLEHAPQVRDWDVRILATDLSPNVLEQAASGRFTQFEVNRGLTPALKSKYFTNVGEEWRVKDEVRRWIEFRPMNLAQPWPALPRFDLIFLRNVMIYFDVPTKQAILSRARAVLHPAGHLFLGTAETTVNLDPLWQPLPLGLAVAYTPVLE